MTSIKTLSEQNWVVCCDMDESITREELIQAVTEQFPESVPLLDGAIKKCTYHQLRHTCSSQAQSLTRF